MRDRWWAKTIFNVVYEDRPTFIRGPSEAEAKSSRSMFDRSAQKQPLLFSNIFDMAASKTLAIDLDKALRLQNVVQSGDFSITQRP